MSGACLEHQLNDQDIARAGRQIVSVKCDECFNQNSFSPPRKLKGMVSYIASL